MRMKVINVFVPKAICLAQMPKTPDILYPTVRASPLEGHNKEKETKANNNRGKEVAYAKQQRIRKMWMGMKRM